MGRWLFLLEGLLVWAGHFFGVYIAASLFPGMALARWLVAGLTIAAVTAILFLEVRARRESRGEDGLTGWIAGLSGLGRWLAGIAVLYQGLPALLA